MQGREGLGKETEGRPGGKLRVGGRAGVMRRREKYGKMREERLRRKREGRLR